MNWEANVRRVLPYVPGEQPKAAGIVKLNTNECPYPPSPMTEEVLRTFDTDKLRRYPDPAAGDLVRAIAQRYGRKEKEVFAGVGSDDVLAMCFLTFFNGGKEILFPDITYSFYDVWASLFRIPYRTVPLTGEFRIEPEDYAGRNGGVVIANPNAPTGEALPLSSIRRILDLNPDCVVIVDEAYVDFGAESANCLIPEYENLLVVQTSSKSRAMAGVRIGWAMGNEKLIRYLNDVKYSFNSYTLSSLQIAAGAAALADEPYFLDIVRKVTETRAAAEERFRDLGFSFQASAANFLFVTHDEMPAAEIFAQLRARGIYVRYFNKPRIDNYLRITIGTPEEMEKLFAALKEILGRTDGASGEK